MSKIRVGGVWKNFTRKIRVGGVWKLACLKYRIGGVWKDDSCSLNLELPAPTATTTINLATWIAANAPAGKTNITVVNNHVQPQIISGNLTGLNITLVNNSEIQGNNSGADGMILTTPLKVINYGVIKAAGGAGGVGSSGSSASRTVYRWDDRRGPFTGSCSYVNGNYVSGTYLRRWWDWNGSNAHWQMTLCGTEWQFNPRTLGSWGNQANSFNYGGGYKSGPKSGGLTSCWLPKGYANALVGGAGGAAGQGRHFWQSNTAGGAGGNGYVTGTNSGFDGNGWNVTSYVASNGNGNVGYPGGSWGQHGSTGNPPGDAVSGSTHLSSGSDLGTNLINLIGNVT